MSLPQCFGLFWEGIASNKDCYEDCSAKDECLAKFATETLVKYQRELGEAATVHALSQVTGIRPEAILLAIDYQNRVSKGQEPQRSPVRSLAQIIPSPGLPGGGPTEILVSTEWAAVVTPETPVPMPPPVPSPALPAGSEMGETKERMAEVMAEVEAAAQELSEVKGGLGVETEFEEESPQKAKEKAAPIKKAASKKKAPPAATKKPPKAEAKGTKAVPKKKVLPRKKKGASANPPQAGAAKGAAAPAKQKQAKFVEPAEAPEERRAWSPEHDLARFRREWNRNPLIRKLPTGYVLERRWPYEDNTGPLHRVLVGRDSYRYKDQEYPTLYAVLQKIVGFKTYPKQVRSDGSRPKGNKVSTSWSVTKFFCLAKIILSLKEERAGKGKCAPPAWKKPKKRRKKRKYTKTAKS